MESLGMKCGKSLSITSTFRALEQQSWRRSWYHHRHLLMGKSKQSFIKPIQITRSCANLISSSPFNLKEETRSWGQQNKLKTHEKLDEWMRDSVSEIVTHIGEAPFLVHIYSPTKKNEKLELERETAMVDSWPSIRRRWKEGCPIPDGVILVEQLDKEDEDEDSSTTAMATGTKAWGVLIQGKGVDTAACYILKTCRVWSSLGFCTHFCLVKAKCFGETAELQLQNAWNAIPN